MADTGVITAREVARRVLERVDRGGAWATLALDGELVRAKLIERDRRLTTELVYGVLRRRPRLDRALSAHADLRRTPSAVVMILRVAAYQLLFLDRVPAHAAVDDAVEAARRSAGPKVAGFANAVLRKLAAKGEPPLPDGPVRDRLEIACSMPRWIIDMIADALTTPAGALDDAELEAAVMALDRPAPLVARVNLQRSTVVDVAAALTAEGATVTPLPAAPAALQVEHLGDPARSASHRAGLWTVQDLAAQRVGLLAAPRRGTFILDACSGVGGKSAHLAELTADQAAIDAVDVSAQKSKLAAESCARLGLTSVRPVVADLTTGGAALAAFYDLVLLDAPCTGLGVLRRHPEARWRLTPADVERMAILQAGLIDAVAARVSPGGALVYSVCTFSAAEGPGQVASFLRRHADFVRDPDAAELRTWPHRDDADGFYAVRLLRRA